MNQVKRYHTMNNFAEERECIEAEAREHLSLLEYNEQRDKKIGNSSISRDNR